MVALSHLWLLRARVGLSPLRRLARHPQDARAWPGRRRGLGASLSPLRPRASTPASCPDCGSVALARHGVGTERLATLLSEAAAPLPVFRLDSDSAARVGGHLQILRRFDQAESGVLVGTQMVAKGHDFPDVVLSVVLDADATLRFPDFRAEERTFALVSQLAGRSGRGERGEGCWCRRWPPTPPRSATRQPTTPRDSSPESSSGAGRFATHPSPTWCGSSSPRRMRRRPSGRPSCSRTGYGLRFLRTPSCSARRPAFGFGARDRRQLLIKAGDREPAVAAVRAAVEAMVADGALREVALGVDVDPQ